VVAVGEVHTAEGHLQCLQHHVQQHDAAQHSTAHTAKSRTAGVHH
jgi:hypothetical protein